MLAAGSLVRAGHVNCAGGLAVGIEVEVEEDLEVGVEHEIRQIVGADGFPLPVRHAALIAGILVKE